MNLNTFCTLAAVAFVLSIGIWLYRTRPRSSSCNVTPLSADERAFQWRERLDVTHGLNSETVLDMHARGAIAKRKMLAEIRNRETMKRLSVEGVDVTVKPKLRLAR